MEKFLNTKIFEVHGVSLDVATLITLVIFILVTIGILRFLKFLIYRSKRLGSGEKFSINKLSRYVISVLAFLIALQILGFDITVFLAGSAALLVGIGFGLQNIFSDFISGVILLFGGAIKVEDIIEVNGKIYMVDEISFRTTTVVGRDENYVILPNSHLTNNNVINWTYKGRPSRFRVDIGVDYDTNVDELMTVLTSVANENKRVLKSPQPFVRFEDYEDSSLKFTLFFYTYEIFKAEQIKSELRIKIFEKLNEHHINIPFPQRVIRYYSEKEEAQE